MVNEFFSATANWFLSATAVLTFIAGGLRGISKCALFHNLKTELCNSTAWHFSSLFSSGKPEANYCHQLPRWMGQIQNLEFACSHAIRFAVKVHAWQSTVMNHEVLHTCCLHSAVKDAFLRQVARNAVSSSLVISSPRVVAFLLFNAVHLLRSTTDDTPLGRFIDASTGTRIQRRIYKCILSLGAVVNVACIMSTVWRQCFFLV